MQRHPPTLPARVVVPARHHRLDQRKLHRPLPERLRHHVRVPPRTCPVYPGSSTVSSAFMSSTPTHTLCGGNSTAPSSPNALGREAQAGLQAPQEEATQGAQAAATRAPARRSTRPGPRSRRPQSRTRSLGAPARRRRRTLLQRLPAGRVRPRSTPLHVHRAPLRRPPPPPQRPAADRTATGHAARRRRPALRSGHAGVGLLHEDRTARQRPRDPTLPPPRRWTCRSPRAT